jgi:hypothetical protein
VPVARRDRIAAAPPMGWTGWYRPGGAQWQPLCNGASYDGAWGALLAEMGRAGRGGEWVVLRVGERP